MALEHCLLSILQDKSKQLIRLVVQPDSEEPLSCVMSAVQSGVPDLMNCQCGYHAPSVFANMFIADPLCMADVCWGPANSKVCSTHKPVLQKQMDSQNQA